MFIIKKCIQCSSNSLSYLLLGQFHSSETVMPSPNVSPMTHIQISAVWSLNCELKCIKRSEWNESSNVARFFKESTFGKIDSCSRQLLYTTNNFLFIMKI